MLVCHDERIDRTSDGEGFIRDMTYDELLQYRFSNGMKEYPDARIPTLRQVYELLAPTGLTVNVELKTDNFWYDGIEEKCLKIAEECGMTAKVLYSSFNHKSLGRLLSLNPNVPTGLLYGKPLDVPDEARYAVEQKAFAVHPHWRNCHRDGYMESMKAAGICVHPWTVDDPDEIGELMRMGIQAVISNKPDVALKVAGR